MWKPKFIVEFILNSPETSLAWSVIISELTNFTRKAKLRACWSYQNWGLGEEGANGRLKSKNLATNP